MALTQAGDERGSIGAVVVGIEEQGMMERCYERRIRLTCTNHQMWRVMEREDSDVTSLTLA